jgi:hypothetical protein
LRKFLRQTKNQNQVNSSQAQDTGEMKEYPEARRRTKEQKGRR